jgi:ABC-type bacteriocin/lantibiotic exporter with double-glycine peptidase domain
MLIALPHTDSIIFFAEAVYMHLLNAHVYYILISCISKPSIVHRKSIAIVPQYATLFSGTIRYNLLFSNPNADLIQDTQESHTQKIDFLGILLLGKNR